jgi:hypothetical protein
MGVITISSHNGDSTAVDGAIDLVGEKPKRSHVVAWLWIAFGNDFGQLNDLSLADDVFIEVTVYEYSYGHGPILASLM